MTAAELHDVTHRDDLTSLLDDFYRRAFADDLLGPVFVDVARMDLAAHLPDITDFWSKALLKEGDYRRNMFEPHRALHEKADLRPEHFERWLELWHSTVDDNHTGERADLAKLQGARIAYSMCRMLTGELSLPIADWLEDSGQNLGVHSARRRLHSSSDTSG